MVGGVEPVDLPDPALALDAFDNVGFLVSLELRESAVTARADVVLPVAPAVEKAGTYLDWEGRPRPFAETLNGTGSLSDHRVLDRIADELDVPLGPVRRHRLRAEIESAAALDGRPPACARSPPRPAAAAAAGEAVLASWRQLLDEGSLQDGEPFLAATARRPVARLSAATAAGVGVAEGDLLAVGTGRGTITLPLVIADLPDGVVWLPGHSAGSSIHRDLGAGAGAVVRIGLGSAPPRSPPRRWKPTEDSMTTPLVTPRRRATQHRPVLPAVVLRARHLVADRSSRSSSSSCSWCSSTLFMIWAERRVVARMQQRLGPNRVGPLGLGQGLADGIKLALKEDIIPALADKPVYVLAPVLSAIPAFMAFAVIPVGGRVSIFGHMTALQITDLPVAVLWILACSLVRRLRPGARRLVQRLDLPAARRPALVGPGDLVRGRDGPGAGRRSSCRRARCRRRRSSSRSTTPCGTRWRCRRRSSST